MGQKQEVTRSQFELLVKIGYAADNARKAALDLAGMAQRIGWDLNEGRRRIGWDLNEGRRPGYGLSHQTPTDFWQAQAKLEALVEVAAAQFDRPALAELVTLAIRDGERGVYESLEAA